MGSFRLTAGTWHLHHGYSFTGSLVETVLQSLRHSCRSELTRQGTSLPRTVIVTAAVYRGFGRQLPLRSPAPLTYRHRAGVRLYTSSCELAESCVFDKQSLEPIPAAHTSRCEHPLYRRYGVILPSSFTRVLPNAFGCSPSTPVSDCGTGRWIVRTGLFVAELSGDFRIGVPSPLRDEDI